MDAIQIANRVIDTEDSQDLAHESQQVQRTHRTPHISHAQRRASFIDRPTSLGEVRRIANEEAVTAAANGRSGSQKTFLYLAYGSNLCAQTFQGVRGIKPLSQTNVVVPSITLTFDLSGIPYSEPCFSNCRYRTKDDTPTSAATTTTTTEKGGRVITNDYHKDRWKKGLVGVVYEVTASDFAHIIATEGGGAGYKDVLVDCYPLSDDPTAKVPLIPTTEPFKAHTLFAPVESGNGTSNRRPDTSYAQPSARYKKLITDGAQEHNLPHEYRTFLDDIRPYEITTKRQQLGKMVFLGLWGSIFAFLFRGGLKMFLRKDGTYPAWVAALLALVFRACWQSYDHIFFPIFGDGERTLGQDPDGPDNDDDGDENQGSKADDDDDGNEIANEKTQLLYSPSKQSDEEKKKKKKKKKMCFSLV